MTVYADTNNTSNDTNNTNDTTNNASNTTSTVDSNDRICNAKPNKPLQKYQQESRELLYK